MSDPKDISVPELREYALFILGEAQSSMSRTRSYCESLAQEIRDGAHTREEEG